MIWIDSPYKYCQREIFGWKNFHRERKATWLMICPRYD